jgi:hypothetical protein
MFSWFENLATNVLLFLSLSLPLSLFLFFTSTTAVNEALPNVPY